MSELTTKGLVSPSTATTGAASLLALFALSESRAAVVTSTGLNLSPVTLSFDGENRVDWNIDGVGIAEVQFGVSSYNPGVYFRRANNSFGFVGAPGDNDLRNLALLPSPETISAARAFFNGAQFVLGSGFDEAVGFVSGEQGYIGFRFKPTAGEFVYGWASVTITPGFGGSLTVTEWAFDDSGASIHVGQTVASAAVPEPAGVAAGLGALALGAAGLMRWRRHRAG